MSIKNLATLTISLMIILVISTMFASAVCTVTFDSDTYVKGETVTASMLCSENGEKNLPYTLNWTNASGYQLEIDTGTTPPVRNTLFAQTYIIPTVYVTPYGTTLKATLQGTNLEGQDIATISAPATTNLLIQNIQLTSGYYIGKYGAVSFYVRDSNGNNISNARCIANAIDSNGLPMFDSGAGVPTQGNGKVLLSQLLTPNVFEKGKTYRLDIACVCFNTSGYTSSGIGNCYEVETGNRVLSFKSAQTTYPFTINDLADEILVNKTVDITLGTGIWVENEEGFRANMTANLSNLYQENINWSTYNNSNGMAFLTAGEKFRICMYANNTFEDSKYIELDHVHLIRNPGTEIFPYCMNGEMCEDNEIMHMEIQEGNYQKCGDWIKLPEYIKGQNNYKVIFHLGIEGYEQEIELSSDRFTVFGEKSHTDYIPLVDITNVTTDKYHKNISSLSNIQVTFTYNYFGDDEDVFIAEYCFEQTDDDSIGGCYERYFNPDFGLDKQIKDTFELPYFLNDGAAEVSITVFQNHDASRTAENIRGYGDTEPSNTFTIRNFNVTNLTTSAYSSIVDACSDINVTLTYNFWGDEHAIFSGEFCIENTDKDDLKKCEEVVINPDIGAGNTISFLLTLPYFNFGGETEIELFLYKKYPDGTKRFVEHADTEPYNTFNVTAVLTDACKYSQNFNQELGLREVEALEGIENKTGTFHLDVSCPSTGTLGQDMTCNITAQIEDSQLVEKEVDFTCYITDGVIEYSSINLNQMINRTSITLSRDFSVPALFNSGQQYTLQCHADYYNLGSRRDSFYDTFIAQTMGTETSEEDSSGSSVQISPITGESIQDVKDLIDKETPGTFKELLTKSYFIFPISIILIALLSLITVFIIRRMKDPYRICRTTNTEKTVKIIFSIFGIIILLLVFIIGGFYGYKLINHNFLVKLEKQEIIEYTTPTQEQIEIPAIQTIAPQYSILQDPLFRKIILTAFIVLMIIILFKALRINGELRFGQDDNPIKKYWQDNKYSNMQKKLNQMQVKQEIKHEKEKLDSEKIRTIPLSEFRKSLDRIDKKLE